MAQSSRVSAESSTAGAQKGCKEPAVTQLWLLESAGVWVAEKP